MSRRLGGICNREAAAADRGDPAHGLIHGGLPGLHIKVCGRGDIGVAQKPGNRCNIDSVFDGSCGKGMPHRMKFHMGQPQLFEQPCKVVGQVIGVHHGALPAKDDVVLAGGDMESVGVSGALVLQQLLQNGRHGKGSVGGIGLGFIGNQHGAAFALGSIVIGLPADGMADPEPARPGVVVLPLQGAYLPQPHPGEHGKQDTGVVIVPVGEKVFLQLCLRFIREDLHTGRANRPNSGKRDGVAADHALRQSLLERDIQHDTHIAHAFGGKRSAVAEVAAACFLIKELLEHPGRKRRHGGISQPRENVFFDVVPVVLVAGGLCYRADIVFQPVGKPLPQEHFPAWGTGGLCSVHQLHSFPFSQ